jgi:FSR family fosmidomycin resistance protein-like MFS transporter
MSVAQGSLYPSDNRTIGLISLAHGTSHFYHLVLPPLFPWLKTEFALSYAELGLLMTIFFVVSCAVQASSGFLVDHKGARPVLFAGVGLLALSALTYAVSSSYVGLVIGAVLMGCGNGVFHPVDYTLMNHKISPKRLPYAYSFHGVTGYLGWAFAPVFMVVIAELANWRTAMMAAAILALVVLFFLWMNRELLTDDAKARHESNLAAARKNNPNHTPLGTFDFLKLPAVWLCWIFFFLSMVAMAGIQSFAPSALLKIYDISVASGNFFLTLLALGSAGGMILGGYIASKLASPERTVVICLMISALMSIVIGTEIS